MTLENIADEVGKAMEGRFCEPKRNGMITYYLGYNQAGCPKTCTYARSKNELKDYLKVLPT